MRHVSPWPAIVLILSAVSACGKARPQTAPTPPPPAQVTAQKWFSVDKHNRLFGCGVRITPNKGEHTALKVGMEVAWLLTNECDDSSDLILTFFRDGDRRRQEEPIEFESIVNGVLKGKVKDIGPPAGGVRFKYSAQSGRHKKDPEIVIFP